MKTWLQHRFGDDTCDDCSAFGMVVDVVSFKTKKKLATVCPTCMKKEEYR